MRIGIIALAAAAIGLAIPAGAQERVDPSNHGAVSSQTKVERDPYTGIVTVAAPAIPVSARRAFTPPDTLQMYGSKAAAGEIELALYVSMITDTKDGTDYRTAASGGRQLRVQTEAPRIRGCGGGRYLRGSCSYLEGLWIIFDADMLAHVAADGFSFAVYGEGPRKEFNLPAAYFAAFKAAFEAATN